MSPDVVWTEPRQIAGACPVAHTVGILGGKWTLLIVRELLGGPKRFGALATGLGTVNPKTLTERLRLLEQQGIVDRTAYAEMPPRVEYALTARGRTLEPVLGALWRWGADDLLGAH